jgi:polyisoprenyl-phosphate glycosyltransferase
MESKPEAAISVVVPVYGSESILTELVAQLVRVLDGESESYGEYEIVLVCDNSPDDSWAVIKDIAAKNDRVLGVHLRVNAGQHNAVMAGLRLAKGEVIVTMDDDLQHSPYDIPILLRELERGLDVVYANFGNREHASWKVLGSKVNGLAARYLLEKPSDLYLSPFRTFRSTISHSIQSYRGPYPYIDGLILSSTRSISSVVVAHYPRFEGKSGYSLKRSVSLWLKMATGFSVFPLRLTSLLGFFFSMLGLLLALLLVVQKFTLDAMPIGWSSLIVTSLILGGVQLLGLGIIGEYLGRVLLTLNAKPQYIVREVTGDVGSREVHPGIE